MDSHTYAGQTMIFLKNLSTVRSTRQARCLAIIVALSIVSVCAARAQDFVDHTIKFTPSALVHGWKAFDIRKWQEGTVNGVYYEFDRNGNGSFRRPRARSSALGLSSDMVSSLLKGEYYSRKDHWSVRCGKDAMDDYRWCSIAQGDLKITYFDSDETRVRIGRDHYPGTRVRLRIDGDKPISTSKNGWSGNSAKRVVDRLTAGRKVTTRYQEWPYKSYKDSTTDLFGLSLAYEYVVWAVHGQRRISPATNSSSSGKNGSALVRQIQKNLLDRGYYTGNVDGLYGPQTKSAIKRYEQNRGLTITGKATQELFADINREHRRSSFEQNEIARIIQQQLRRCWRLDPGTHSAEHIVVEIRIVLNPDGSVQQAEIVDVARMVQDGFFRSAAENAKRAINRCSPFRLPPAKYEHWRKLTLRFDLAEMFGQ